MDSFTTIPAYPFIRWDYTNNPLIIAGLKNIAAINSVLQLDLSGQASADPSGRTIIAESGVRRTLWGEPCSRREGRAYSMLKSTARNGTASRIVPAVDAGAGITLNRGDIHYIVTEYGMPTSTARTSGTGAVNHRHRSSRFPPPGCLKRRKNWASLRPR